MPSAVLDFWRGKSAIYEKFINREEVVLWESGWTEALKRCCVGLALDESLQVSEDELIAAVQRRGLPPYPA